MTWAWCIVIGPSCTFSQHCQQPHLSLHSSGMLIHADTWWPAAWPCLDSRNHWRDAPWLPRRTQYGICLISIVFHTCSKSCCRKVHSASELQQLNKGMKHLFYQRRLFLNTFIRSIFFSKKKPLKKKTRQWHNEPALMYKSVSLHIAERVQHAENTTDFLHLSHLTV